MMQISHEVPVDILPVSKTFNDYDYALVHLFEELPEYKDFYYQSVKSRRKVLLDNSIFELKTAFDPEKFAFWVNDLKPAEYVVPDVLGSMEGTLASLEDFRSRFPITQGTEIVVVQGKTWNELLECFTTYSKDEKVKKIAIPFQIDPMQIYGPHTVRMERALNVPNEWMEVGGQWAIMAVNRIALLHELEQRRLLTLRQKIHLLGCSVPWEFKYYRKLILGHYIESMDTSNPIVAAMLGKSYDKNYGVLEKWPCILVDFIKNKLNREQLLLAWKNVNLFRKLLS